MEAWYAVPLLKAIPVEDMRSHILLHAFHSTICARLSGVEAAVVLTTQDSSGSKCLVAYFTPANADPAAVRLHCSSMLPSAAVPAACVPISHFRTTATGKIDTLSLPREVCGG
jgi:acyl-CoA synthetase (AMP-forming)/AMP-acid ligase II